MHVGREPLDENGRHSGIKESTRWIESYERVAEQAATLPDTRLVYVTDREGDIAALMDRADELGHPADWLIRAPAQPQPGRGRQALGQG